MFTSVRIQNFRQFRDLKLDGLAQINLITGANNTGKTSLLEALFLLDEPRDPSRTVSVARFRGVDPISSETSELWGWLFRDQDTSRPIEITGVLDSGERSGFIASVSRGSLIPASRPGDSITSARSAPSVMLTEPLPSLMFDLSPSDDKRRIELRWTGQGLALDPDLRAPGVRGYFLPDALNPSEYEAVRFSRLELVGSEKAAVDALRVVEPRLRKLTVLNLGERSSVYADLGQFPLVPIAMMGQGFGKLLTILPAIILEEAPAYLIDEIGNGFHYSILVDVWKTIIETAIRHSAQIFATTHSYECIEAAVKASEDRVGKLALFRLERHKDGIRAVDLEDEDLRSAVGLGVELR